MKFLSSVPAAAKIGGAGVLGGGGIAGTGVLIHNHLQKAKEVDYKLQTLDEELIKESEVSFEWGEGFVVGSTNQYEATATVKAKSKTGDKFSGDKWACVIKGIAKNSQKENVALTTQTTINFDASAQKSNFEKKFKESQQEKTNLEGFVKSCARNRTDSQKKAVGTLTSDIKVYLQLGTGSNSAKYEFSDKDIETIFKGDWINPKE